MASRLKRQLHLHGEYTPKVAFVVRTPIKIGVPPIVQRHSAYAARRVSCKHSLASKAIRDAWQEVERLEKWIRENL